MSFDSIEIINVLKHLNYRVFTNGLYNVNIIGVRNNSTKPNSFDDELHIIYRDNKNAVIHKIYDITTDAGLHYLLNPMNSKGTALLVPNQYRGTWKIGLHRGKYEALVQSKPVKVWRDGNKDNVLDFDSTVTHEGVFGINIHRANANRESVQVDKWSAGCQVFANPDSYADFMSIIKKSRDIYGNSFTYTLVTEKDVMSYRNSI